MGLFDTPEAPQQALPIMEIHITSPPNKVFKPYDVVEGYIALVPAFPIAPQALEVSLFGRTQISHRTYRRQHQSIIYYYHWRDNAPLFEITTNVLQTSASGPTTLDVGQTYKYPFQSRLPMRTDNSRKGQYKQDDDSRWTIGPHQLPPSLRHDKAEGFDGHAGHAQIEYGVRARLVCPGVGQYQGDKLKDMETTVPVFFVPPTHDVPLSDDAPSTLPYPRPYMLQNAVLSGQSPSSIGFRQSMRDRLSHGTPKLIFGLVVELPDTMISGQDFRFRTIFSVRSKTDNVTYIPPVTFSVQELELQEITHIRAPRDMEANEFHDGRHRGVTAGEYMPAPDMRYSGYEMGFSFNDKHPLQPVPPSATVQLDNAPSYGDTKMADQAGSCEAWFSAWVPGITPPSFKSFAISRDYRVRVKVLVEVGGKTFEYVQAREVGRMGSSQT